MNNEIFNIIFPVIVIFAVIAVFIYISLKVRRGGGSMTTLMYGATDEFYNKEKKKAIEYVVEQKAGKKTREDHSGKKAVS